MKALIYGGVVRQIEAAEFPVAAPFFWVDTGVDPVEPGWSYDEGAQTFAAPAGRDLEVTRTAALAGVDAAAETARQRFITPGPGQALSYDAKRREAGRWAAGIAAATAPDPANYPWARSRAARLNLVLETAVTMAQAQAVIDEWTARAAAWTLAGIEIERVREGAKDAITAAADIAAIDAALADIVWPAPV